MDKQGYVYMVSNASRNVLYTGIISSLESRIYQHKNKLVEAMNSKWEDLAPELFGL